MASEPKEAAIHGNAKRRTAQRTPKRKAVAKPYEPTPEERVAIEAMAARKKELPVAPRMNVTEKKGVSQISPDHPDLAVGHILLMEALGTVELDFLDGLLGHLANAGTQGRVVDERGLNFMLALVKGVEPKDLVETMLATQMAAVHMATMTFARRLAHVDNIPQQDSAERAFNKLARTFAAQVEDDPLFPATKVTLDANHQFQASGLERKHWSNAGPIRTIFKEAFTRAKLPYFNPHSFRNTLAQLGQRLCRTPEQFKAWSQNLGHEKVMTTFTSYGEVAPARQAVIIRELAHVEEPDAQVVELARKFMHAARNSQ